MLFLGRNIRVNLGSPNLRIKKQVKSLNSIYVKFSPLQVYSQTVSVIKITEMSFFIQDKNIIEMSTHTNFIIVECEGSDRRNTPANIFKIWRCYRRFNQTSRGTNYLKIII